MTRSKILFVYFSCFLFALGLLSSCKQTGKQVEEDGSESSNSKGNDLGSNSQAGEAARQVALLNDSLLAISDAQFTAIAVEAFSKNNVTGTFVMEHLNSGERHCFNPKRAATRFIPASTFKIPHSLMALEDGLVKDTNEIFKWDGEKRRVRSWNQDMNLRKAFRFSALWVYQELATRAGDTSYYVDWLERLDYGNKTPSGGLTEFWLDGGLAISPDEQVSFLQNLYNNTYGVSKENLSILKAIINTQRFENGEVFAKTGWAVVGEKNYGWYVGWVENESGPWFFAMHMDILNQKQGRLRISIPTEIISKTLGVTPIKRPKQQQPKKKGPQQQPTIQKPQNPLQKPKVN